MTLEELCDELLDQRAKNGRDGPVRVAIADDAGMAHHYEVLAVVAPEYDEGVRMTLLRAGPTTVATEQLG